MDKTIYSAEQIILSGLLREFREQNRLRQIDVARLLGVPQSFVSKYESGERRLDLIEIRQVAAALGTSAMQIVAAFEERLTAPQYDALAALDADQPAGPVDDEV